MSSEPRFSQLASASETAAIQKALASLTSAGWTVGEGKKASAPSREQAFLVARASVAYGLDPLMGELLVLGNKLYVTAAGLRRHAATRGLRRIATRPLNAVEREEHRVGEDEEAWIAEVYVRDEDLPFVGYGYADPLNSAVATVYRWEDGNRSSFLDRRILRGHAETRAVSRALRLAFAVPLPVAEDRGQEPIDVTPAETPSAPAAPPPTTVRGRTSQLPAPAPTTAPVVETRQPELIPVAAPAQPVELDADGAYHEIGQIIERLFNEDDDRREAALERAAVLEPDAVVALHRAVSAATTANAARQILLRGAP